VSIAVVLYDACVRDPGPLRDLPLDLAQTGRATDGPSSFDAPTA
jgi:hypothetical protein